MNKKEVAERIKVAIKTIYNWEKEKPELIRLINLGIEKEKEEKQISNIINGNQNVVHNGNGSININHPSEMDMEIVKEIMKLNDKKKEYFFYLIKAENLKD